MPVETLMDDGSFGAQLLHLTSTKLKSRHDALHRLKSVVDDGLVNSLTEATLREFLLSILTFSKIECKTGNRITSEASLKDKVRTATSAVKWALGIFDKTYPRIVSAGLARQLIGEVVLLCDVVSGQFHVELLSSLNLYVLNKREYLLSIDTEMWQDLIPVLKSLPRSSHADRKEVMTTLAYFNLVVPHVQFDALCTDLAAAIYALLEECTGNNSRSEEYTIMLALKQLTWSVKRLADVDIRSCRVVCVRLHGLLMSLGKKQLFIDQEILNLIHCIESRGITELDWRLIHEGLQLPSHVEQMDPLKFLYAIQTGTSQDPTIQYMLSYLAVYDLHATGDIDEFALIRAKRIDALFVKTFYIGIRRGLFGTNYVNNCLKALSHMEASALLWHLTALSMLRIEHLTALAPLFFRKSTSPIISTLFLQNYNPTCTHSYLLDVFTTQVPVLSCEFLKLFIHDFIAQYMTAGNFLWTDSALNYFRVMLDWILLSMTREALTEYPLVLISAILVPFLRATLPYERQETEWSRLRDVSVITTDEPKFQQLQNERFTDYSNVIHKFLAQLVELKFDQQLMGPILAKSSSLVSTLNASRIPMIALVVSAVSELVFVPFLETFVLHQFVQDYVLLRQLAVLLPNRALLVITQSLVEALESGISTAYDEFEGQTRGVPKVDPTCPATFTFCLNETEAHTAVDTLAHLYLEMTRRRWSEEDAAFMDDLKRYLEDQITCSLQLCSRHFEIVGRDKLVAFAAQRLGKPSTNDVASSAALLPILKHLGDSPSDLSIFPTLASQSLDLMWSKDANKAVVACSTSYPNAVKTFLSNKTLQSEHFLGLINWNACTKVEQIRTFALMLRKSDAEIPRSIYSIITRLDLVNLHELIDDISGVISEFLCPILPLQMLSLMIETWLKDGKQLTDFPVELFGVPPDPSRWTLEVAKTMVTFLVQTKNLDLARSFLPLCYAEYYVACLVHKVKNAVSEMTVVNFLQIVALLISWNRDDLIPQVCEEAQVHNFDHRHPILLPLILKYSSERYGPSQYSFKVTTVCSLAFELLTKHASLNLLKENLNAPKLLQILVKAKKTAHHKVIKECCLRLAEASLKMTKSLQNLVIAFCKAMHEQGLLDRGVSLSIESVVSGKNVVVFDESVLLRLFELLNQEQLKHLLDTYTEKKVCSLLSATIAKRLHEFTEDKCLKEYVLKYFKGYSKPFQDDMASPNLATALLLNLYNLLKSLDVNPQIEFDILAFLSKFQGSINWHLVPDHVASCFEHLKQLDTTLLPKYQHTTTDLISRQLSLLDPELYSCLSPALLEFPTVKQALHRCLLFTCGMSQGDAFAVCFQGSLDTELSIVETVRAVSESVHDGQGQKSRKISEVLSKFASPIFDQCAKKDKTLGLYLVMLLSEYVENIDVTPFLCTPDLEGLTHKHLVLEFGNHLERVEEDITRATWLAQQWTLTDIAHTTTWDASVYYLLRQTHKFNADKSKAALQVYNTATICEETLCFLSEFSRGDVMPESESLQVERVASCLDSAGPLQLHRIINRLIGMSGRKGLAIDSIRLLETRPSLQLVKALNVSKFFWVQGCQESAIDICQRAEPLSDEDPALVALFLSRQMKWSFVTRSLTSIEIAARFVQPLLELLREPVHEGAKCYLKLARYYDALYESERSSENTKHLQQLIRHLEAEIDACKRLMTKKDHEKQYDRLYSHLRHQLISEKQELEQVRLQQQRLLQSAVECFLNVLQFAESPKHEMVVYRVHSLWFSNSLDEQLCKTIHSALTEFPVKAFIPLIYQLAARLDSEKSTFQQTLQALIYRMARQYTPQCLSQLLALRNLDKKRKLEEDGRSRTAEGMLEQLNVDSTMISAITKLSNALIELSLMEVTQETAIQHLQAKKPVPIPSKMLLKRLGDISDIPMITVSHLPDAPISVFMHSFLGDGFNVVGGINVPKVIEARGSDGKTYRMLVKGKDDVRQDAVMEQVFVQVRRMLNGLSTDITIRTYRVIPLQPTSGVLEWVQDSVPLGDYLMPAHDSIYPDDLSCRELRHLMKKEHERAGSTTASKLEIMNTVLATFRPVMRHFFFDKFHTPEAWYAARRTYTGSTATASIVGWIVGLGDRHMQNILLDTCTGQVIHIDLNMIFEVGTTLRIPERVPFRLTMNVVDGLLGVFTSNPSDQQLLDGPFGRDAQHVLRVLRKQSSVLTTIIEVFRHDPLVRWSVSPIKLARQLQEHASIQFANFMESTAASSPSLDFNKEAETALMRIKGKLREELSPRAQVAALISEARNRELLCQMYTGWQPWI